MKKVLKWGGIALVVLFVLYSIGNASKEAAKTRKAAELAASSSPTSQAETTKPQESAPSPTPEPVKSLDIQVTSQIVKKIERKHRYFFDIRNHDTEPFEGSVTITIKNDKDSSLGGDTFTTKQAIEPELGSSVYVDANTGPKSVHGEYGITKFTYVVKQGDKEVAKGEGAISEKFEDLSGI